MSIQWNELDPQKYEDMVAVLVKRLYQDAQRIDGKGGDGGRDLQIVGQDGQIKEAFQLKSFTGRVDSGRRKQVERSLKRAATLEPAQWALVVPIDPSPSEESWFRRLGRGYGFPIEWFGETWLDEKMSAYPDIRRYFLEGADNEVVRSLKEFHQEQAAITSGHDALGRLHTLQERLNEIDPYYRYEMATGPAVTHSWPEHVTLSVKSGDRRIDLYPKYPDAVRDRPITINAKITISPDDQEFQNALDYGLPVTIPSHLVSDVTLDAPSGLGGSFPGAEIDLRPTSTRLDEPIILSLIVMDGDRIIASCPAQLTEQTSGQRGSIATGTDGSGWLGMRTTVNAVAGEFTIQFWLTPKPILPSSLVPLCRWLRALQPPHYLKVCGPAGLELSGQIESPILPDETLPMLVEALAYLQDSSGIYWEMPGSLTREEARDFITAATLLKGETIDFTWKSLNLNLSRWGPKLDDLLKGRPQQFICEQDQRLEMEGITIPIGRIRTVCSVRLGDPEDIKQALESGLVPQLRLVPGDSDKAQRVLVSHL